MTPHYEQYKAIVADALNRKIVDIQAHPALNEIRERYEWDDKTEAFPVTLKDGRPNPFFGIVAVVVKIPN